MKRSNARIFVIALFLIGSFASCVSISKIRYLEPVGDNKKDWTYSREKDSFFAGFYKQNLIRPIKDNNEVGLGKIILEFEFNYWSQARFYPYHLAIIDESDKLLKKIDLDSISFMAVRDSLQKLKIGTGHYPSYNKFATQIICDSTLIPAKLHEFFMGYAHSRYMGVNIGFRLKKGQQLKIITGDPYLDEIFKQYVFEVKTKTKMGIMTHIN